MAILIFVNIVVVIFNTIDKVKNKKRLAKLKKIREQRLKIVEILFDIKRSQVGKVGFEVRETDQEKEDRVILMSSLEQQGQDLDRLLNESSRPKKRGVRFSGKMQAPGKGKKKGKAKNTLDTIREEEHQSATMLIQEGSADASQADITKVQKPESALTVTNTDRDKRKS